MAEKVTVMVLKVDLQCSSCYKKVKKILCKFPQIKDQEYDEKGNKVTIKVVCCNPERIREKLCCKGRKVITSIEIKEPVKPKDPEKPKEPEKPKTVVVEKPKTVDVEKPKEPEKPKEVPKPNPAPIPPKTPEHVLIHYGCPSIFPMQPTCCGQCSQGYGGGPCHYGYGVPPPPQPCCAGYYGYGGQGRGNYGGGCDYYYVDENPQSCSIM